MGIIIKISSVLLSRAVLQCNIKPMEKEKVIELFKNLCEYPHNVIGRKIAVETQHNRLVWEVYGLDGIIRISNLGTAPKITFYRTIMSLDDTTDRTLEYDLSLGQYMVLKNLYFGEFKPDDEYLQKWDKK